jgi:hypothetical protein
MKSPYWLIYILDPSRFLLARLTLRKRAKWHRADALRVSYCSEIGPHVEKAIEELCRNLKAPSAPVQPIIEVIDVDCDDDYAPQCVETPPLLTQTHTDETLTSPNILSSVSSLVLGDTLVVEQAVDNAEGIAALNIADIEPTFDFFAEDDSAASVEEVLGCLQLEELKAIARGLKVFKSGMTVWTSPNFPDIKLDIQQYCSERGSNDFSIELGIWAVYVRYDNAKRGVADALEPTRLPLPCS